MKPYIIAGIVAGLCSAVAYRIGYADGRRPFKLDVQHYSSGKIIVYPTPTPAPSRSVAKLKMKSGEWYWVEATCPANGFPTVEIRPWEEKR